MRLFATSWIRTGIATAVFVASAGGCQVLVTLDTSPGPDAAVDASTSEASPLPRVPNACDERTLVRPTAPSGGAALIELVFGYVSLDTEPPATADFPLCPTSGFSLDRQPCGAFEGNDASQTGDASVPCRRHCGATDAGTTIDNAAGEMLSEVLGYPGVKNLGVLDPTAALESGAGNLLVRIRNYNERDDDDEVDLEFFGLSGLTADSRPVVDAATPDGGFAGVDAGRWARLWDRHSYREWSVDPTSLAEQLVQSPKYRAQGFVTQHVLVAHPAQIPIAFSGFNVVLDAVTFIGELHNKDGHWSIVRGRIGGDIPIADLAARLPTLAAHDPSLCASAIQPLYSLACDRRDRGPVGGACDALSLAVSFGMVEGTLGLPYEALLPPSNCKVESCK